MVPVPRYVPDQDTLEVGSTSWHSRGRRRAIRDNRLSVLDAALMGAERRLSRLRCLDGHIILAGATVWFWNALRDWLLGRGGAQSQHHIRQLAVDGRRRACGWLAQGILFVLFSSCCSSPEGARQ